MSVPLERLFCETRRVYQALDQATSERHASLGVTARERSLLDLLARKDRPIDATELARAALTPVAELLPALRRLRLRGWILVTVPDNVQPRGIVVSNTGRVALQRLQFNERDLLHVLESACDERDLQATFATLRTVRRLLQRSGIGGY